MSELARDVRIRLVRAESDAKIRVLATAGNTFDTVSGDGDGFAIFGQNITVYDVAGHQLSRIPAGKLSEACGMVDISVPGMGRLILTEAIVGTPAQGINPASYSVVMQAWLAKSGSLAWTATVLPPQSQNLFCGSGLYLGAVFTSTSNGAWGLFSDGSEFVINLRTGALRSDQNALGLLGNYVVDAPSTSSGPTSTDLITDPATGKTVGRFTQVHDGSCIAGAVQLPQDLNLASFSTSTDGVSPSTGMSSDGNVLLALRPVPGSTHCYITIAGYSLPSMQKIWQITPVESNLGDFTFPGIGYYLWGDGGGVAIIGYTDASSNSWLLGVSDTTGKQLWKIPVSATLCGATNSEAMVVVNNQRAIINVKTGKQISYSSGSNTCPELLPGGIEVGDSSTSSGLTVTQVMSP